MNGAAMVAAVSQSVTDVASVCLESQILGPQILEGARRILDILCMRQSPMKCQEQLN